MIKKYNINIDMNHILKKFINYLQFCSKNKYKREGLLDTINILR